jgi:hypothetical protein
MLGIEYRCDGHSDKAHREHVSNLNRTKARESLDQGHAEFFNERCTHHCGNLCQRNYTRA